MNILQKKKKKETLTSWAEHDKTLQETIAFPRRGGGGVLPYVTYKGYVPPNGVVILKLLI